MIIGYNMTFEEKKFFTKMLYNQEAVLALDFSKINKVKKKPLF